MLLSKTMMTKTNVKFPPWTILLRVGGQTLCLSGSPVL